MSMIQSDLLLGQEGGAGYAISRSLRFNSSDSAFLSRTPASAGNRKTWTWAGWVKRGSLGVEQRFFSASTASTNSSYFEFTSGDQLSILNYVSSSVKTQRVTTQVFRDPSAWYHIVVASNSSTSFKVYVNGSEVTTFASSTGPDASDWFFNGANLHTIGTTSYSLANYFSGYLADVHFIDGQALTPSSFTEVSATTGQLIPKAYTGSFGTNGFWLKFSDNSAATATTLGKDYSSNGNNWTPNNLSVTAGAGNDSLVDTPTSYGTDTGAGGEVRGNYATFSPITTSGQGLATLANGNLDISGTGSNYTGCVSTIAVSSGKWYWEYTVTAYGSASGTGLVSSASLSGAVGGSYGYAQVSDGWFRGSTTVANNASNVVTGLSSVGTNDVINVAVDIDAGKLWFGRNGTWESSGNPASGTNATVTFTPGGKSFYALAQGYGTWSGVLSAGARSFAYTAPSGFKALCDTNLPAPVVAQPSTVMDVKLYTGNGSTQTISGLGFSPDLVWLKRRDTTQDHNLYDSVRGSSGGYIKQLLSNLTSEESPYGDGVYGGVISLTADGFSLGSSNADYRLTNASGSPYAAWCFDAGSNTVSNTQGSITSQVRSNGYLSIVTYTGTGSAATVGHGLGVAPSLLIVKQRNAVRGWSVYHKDIGASYYLQLERTDAKGGPYSGLWNDTAPTSSVFSILNDGGSNASGGTYVAYCFAPVAGYSSFGSYTGNGSADGPFVYTGFKPRWVMVKASSTGGTSYQWSIWDTERDLYNQSTRNLWADTSEFEYDSTNYAMDILSNGFKLRTSSAARNSSGVTYVYAAFAESPLQYARAR